MMSLLSPQIPNRINCLCYSERNGRVEQAVEQGCINCSIIPSRMEARRVSSAVKKPIVFDTKALSQTQWKRRWEKNFEHIFGGNLFAEKNSPNCFWPLPVVCVKKKTFLLTEMGSRLIQVETKLWCMDLHLRPTAATGLQMKFNEINWKRRFRPKKNCLPEEYYIIITEDWTFSPRTGC